MTYQDATRRWLNGEAAGDDAVAEAALIEVFAGLPERRPSSGFAARVLAAAGLRPAYPWHFRVAIAVALVLAGAAALFVGPLVAAAVGATAPDVDAGFFAQAIHAVATLLGEALRLASILARFGRIALTVAGTPPVIALMLGLFGLAALVFHSLRTLVRRDRSLSHAQVS